VQNGDKIQTIPKWYEFLKLEISLITGSYVWLGL